MTVKKQLSLLLIILLLLSQLSGCGYSNKKTTLTLSIQSGLHQDFLNAMVDRFPDIDFQIDQYEGEPESRYLDRLIQSGNAGDLIYYIHIAKTPELTKHMIDLSGYPFIGNLTDDTLRIMEVDGKIYQVPGPLNIHCLVYNKTLFEENNWSLPDNFDGLIELIEEIRSDSDDITPIAMDSSALSYPFLMTSTFSQCGFLSTPEGYEWQNRFLNGTASIEEGFDEGITMVERLIDANAFDPLRFSSKESCETKMIERKAAIYCPWEKLGDFMERIGNGETSDEFGFMPFYGMRLTEKVVGFTPSATWSVNSELLENGNERKLAAALEVMEWITSAQAQDLLGSNLAQIPSVNGYEHPASEYLNNLWRLGKDGYKASGLYSGYEHIVLYVGKPFRDAALRRSSTGFREEFVELVNKLNKENLQALRSKKR